MLQYNKAKEFKPVELLSGLSLRLEVSPVPDLLWSVAVLLPQLLDHGASQGGPSLPLHLRLLPVFFRHVTVWWGGGGGGLACYFNI